jgi:ATP-dependent helicase YprA (DUF1998 family)
LKALAVDIARNLAEPVEEMGLPIKLETRAGDTPPNRRQRQPVSPPQHHAHDSFHPKRTCGLARSWQP